MSSRQCLRILILVCLLAGCSSRPEATVASQDGSTAGAHLPTGAEGERVVPAQGESSDASPEDCDKDVSKRKGYRVYRTPDTKQWPCYGPSLEIVLKVPEVPEQIAKPSAPIPQGASAAKEAPAK